MPDIILNEDLKQFVNLDHTIHYIKEMYKNCTSVDLSLLAEVRKIGKVHLDDGSERIEQRSEAAHLLQFDPEDWVSDLAQWVARQVLNTAPLGIGSFMCPGLLLDKSATDKSVRCLVSVCADFDQGNPKQLLGNLCAGLGVRPTIVSLSGGVTEEGHHKLHAHWRLDEPCYEPWKIAYIREQLAKRFGADESFKRIPQVIRIPGSLYNKGSCDVFTEIVEYNNQGLSL